MTRPEDGAPLHSCILYLISVIVFSHRETLRKREDKLEVVVHMIQATMTGMSPRWGTDEQYLDVSGGVGAPSLPGKVFDMDMGDHHQSKFR